MVSEGARLFVRDGALWVKPRGGEARPLPGDVDQVVIATGRASVTAAFLRVAAERGVDVVVDSGMGVASRLYPPVVNRTVENRLAQYRAHGTRLAAMVSVELVYAKIYNQGAVLRYLAKSLGEEWLRDRGYELGLLAEEALGVGYEGDWAGRLRAVEARAARLYWDTVAGLLPPGLGFNGRDQEAPDPFNAALNYGYAILYSRVDKALTLAGLDPYLGFYHALKSGRPSLALDYMEPYRAPAVDRALVANARSLELGYEAGRLDYESRRRVASLILENLSRPHYSTRGRRGSLDHFILEGARRLAASLRAGEPYEAWRVKY